ncbi:MAG: hypothetical protein K8S55_09110, partial [Phycisphaerae bacterium]|nr:hypothetical protein [Phycisphaerae bacterium]
MSLSRLLSIVVIVVGLCFVLWYYLPDEKSEITIPADATPEEVVDIVSGRHTRSRSRPKPDPGDDPKYIQALASKQDKQSADELMRLLAVHARRSREAEHLQQDAAYQRRRARSRSYRQGPCHLPLVQKVLSQTTNPHVFDLLLKNLD